VSPPWLGTHVAKDAPLDESSPKSGPSSRPPVVAQSYSSPRWSSLMASGIRFGDGEDRDAVQGMEGDPKRARSGLLTRRQRIF
jgi:hypothetical protein